MSYFNDMVIYIFNFSNDNDDKYLYLLIDSQYDKEGNCDYNSKLVGMATYKKLNTKFTTFYGCPIQLAVFHLPPYVMFEKDEKTGKISKLYGIEGDIFSTLSNMLNFTLDIHDQSDSNPNVLDNGTATGSLKLVSVYSLILFY